MPPHCKELITINNVKFKLNKYLTHMQQALPVGGNATSSYLCNNYCYVCYILILTYFCMLDVYFWCQMKLCLSVYLYNLRSDSIICFKLPFRIGAAWVLKERLVPDGEGYMYIFIKAGIGIGSSYLSEAY